MDLREIRCGLGAFQILRRASWILRNAKPAQAHAHERVTVPFADIGHDLTGLKAPVVQRPAAPSLEEFEDRKVEILVQRLASAQHLVAVGQWLFDTRYGDVYADSR